MDRNDSDLFCHLRNNVIFINYPSLLVMEMCMARQID